MRSLVKTAIGLYVTGAVLLMVLVGSGCDRTGSDADEIVRAARADSAHPSVVDTLSSGESLYTSLLARGFDASHVLRVLDALGEEVNLRSCKPGDSYTVEVGDEGSISSFSYRRGMTESYRVDQDSTGYAVSKHEIPVIRVTRRVVGQIETSLWEAFLAIGEDPQIALKLADVLGWEFDFVTDTRREDTFVIIFDELFCEGRRIGIGEVVGVRYVNEGREYLAFGFAEEGERTEYYDYEGNSVRRVFLKSPLNYRRISSYFSNRRFHPILKVYRPHHGVDYAAPSGTPVVSIGEGRVVSAGYKGGFGRYVEIRHNNIYTSCYGHLSRYGRGVRKGARVSQGQVIGYVGATGLATGPHLDFRIKKYGSYVNPLRIEYPRGEPIGEDQREAFFAVRDMVLKGLRQEELAALAPE